jgi:hypothetical protein
MSMNFDFFPFCVGVMYSGEHDTCDEVVGSIPSVRFPQACPVCIYTQGSITSIRILISVPKLSVFLKLGLRDQRLKTMRTSVILRQMKIFMSIGCNTMLKHYSEDDQISKSTKNEQKTQLLS